MSTDECLALLRTILSTSRMNERARKELLVRYLSLIFPEPEYRSKLDEFAAGAEAHVPTTVSSLSQSTRGFVDTLNGTLIIEFKADLTAPQVLEQEIGRASCRERV